jgi:hypothetical protein
MTAHSNRLAQPPDDRPNPVDDPAATRDDSPRVAGVVPIAVWRLDDRDDDRPGTEPGAGFASRLARRLVEVYTDPHEIVADFDGDPHLHNAAQAKARTYRAITGPTKLTDADAPRSGVTLVVWRWPRPTTWLTRPTTLFAACHLLMARDGCVIATVRSAEPGQPGASHAEHLARLLPAAQDAGFRHVLQIIAVGGCEAGDQFIYHATSDEAARAAGDPAAGRRVCHIDLLAFIPVGFPHG